MKSNTVQSLITAKTLLSDAMRHIGFGDRYSCSAALILLQDALEIVMHALLLEKNGESQNLDKKSFDELMGDLVKAGVSIPKLVSLKALNKQRVIVKHYGQLAEPVTVQGYAEDARLAIDAIVVQVLGRNLADIYLTDRLNDGAAKTHLVEAQASLDAGNFLECLVSVRKALFVTLESDYAVHSWNGKDTEAKGLMAFYTSGGIKAPSWARSAEWIENNVLTPFDYIKIDDERFRVDCMEWGINTADIHNLRRLTPAVFRFGRKEPWLVQYDMTWGYSSSANSSYCLDRAIDVVLKIQLYKGLKKSNNYEGPKRLDASYVGKNIHFKAVESSELVGRVEAGVEYEISSLSDGFIPGERYYSVSFDIIDGEGIPDYFSGFVKEEPGNEK